MVRLSHRRTLVGVTIIVALVIDAIVVGILIGAKGIVSALPAIAGGIVFIAISLMYWLRSEKDEVNDDTSPPPTTPTK